MWSQDFPFSNFVLPSGLKSALWRCTESVYFLSFSRKALQIVEDSNDVSLGWPTILVSSGPRDFLGCRTISTKIGKFQANQDGWSPSLFSSGWITPWSSNITFVTHCEAPHHPIIPSHRNSSFCQCPFTEFTTNQAWDWCVMGTYKLNLPK